MVTVLLAVYVGLMLLHTVNMGRDCIKHKDDLGKGNWIVSGIIGVIVAAKFVTGLDLNVLTYIIIVVIIITGVMYIRKSMNAAQTAQ